MKIMLSALVCLATLVTHGAIKPLMIGEAIPAGNLKTVEGKPFNLQEAAEESRLVLIYYRGGWCPYCNVHLGQLQHLESELQRLGYRIIAVSPDKPSNAQQSVDKEKLTYTLLSDVTMQTAQSLGIAYTVEDAMLKKLESYNIDIEAASGQKHHMLPVPSVFLIGQDGIIDFVYANPDYTVRLEPEVLLAAAKAAAE